MKAPTYAGFLGVQILTDDPVAEAAVLAAVELRSPVAYAFEMRDLVRLSAQLVMPHIHLGHSQNSVDSLANATLSTVQPARRAIIKAIRSLYVEVGTSWLADSYEQTYRQVGRLEVAWEHFVHAMFVTCVARNSHTDLRDAALTVRWGLIHQIAEALADPEEGYSLVFDHMDRIVNDVTDRYLASKAA